MKPPTIDENTQDVKAGAPLRERPADFREQFIRLGWDCVDHYSTSWKVVARWLEEEGRAAVLADRKAYKQMLALQDRFAVIVDARSSIIPADFLAYVAKHAAAHVARDNMLRR
jgi:hypothetical protein